MRINNIKQTTYEFIAKDLYDTLESHDGLTMQAMLQEYHAQWLQEPRNNRATFTKFVHDYIFNYPMIPFDGYDIRQFLKSFNKPIGRDTDDYIELYIQLVTPVIHELMNNKQDQYTDTPA